MRRDDIEAKLPPVARSTPKCTVRFMNAGQVVVKRGFFEPGAGGRPMLLPALFSLIKHPRQGYVLFDTGYSTRFYDVTTRFPYSLMAKATLVAVDEKDNAVQQLRRLGISPTMIEHVVLSHLHIDHVGGVHDFAGSTFHVSQAEWEFCQSSSLRLLRHFYIKDLFRGIDEQRLHTIRFTDGGYGPFDQSKDLFGDGSLILIPLPGHTVGHMGLLVNVSEEERYFIIADAVYMNEQFRSEGKVHIVQRLAQYRYNHYVNHFATLRRLQEANPLLEIIASHDPAAYDRWILEANEGVAQ